MAKDFDFRAAEANQWIEKVNQEFAEATKTLQEVAEVCKEETNGDTLLEQMVIIGNGCTTSWAKLRVSYQNVIEKLQIAFTQIGQSVETLVENAKNVGRRPNS